MSHAVRGTWRIRELLRRARERRERRAADAAIARFPTVSHKLPHRLPGELIVSLTSYPPRFATLAPTLRSLLDQRVLADRTILWLAPEDLAALPDEVTDLVQHGLEIRTCENWRSFKKLVPALMACPEATIVTADDDVYYGPDWLAQLVEASRANPRAVIGQRVHMALLDADGLFRPYADWQFATHLLDDGAPDQVIFPTGVGGVLYPPHSLDPRVTDSAMFLHLCPTGDDIWFFWMARLAGFRHRGLGNRFRQIDWDGSQDTGLLHANMMGSNDRQIAAMQAHFGKLHDAVRAAESDLP